MNRYSAVVGCWIGVGWVGFQAVVGAETAAVGMLPSRWVPDQAVACLEVTAPSRLVDPLLDPKFVERVAALPAYARRQSSREIQDLLGLTRFLEQTGQTNWQAMIRKITRKGAALAVGSGNRSLLVLEGDDGGLLDRLNGAVRQLASGEAQKQGQSDRVRSHEYAGLTGWTFDGKEAHTIVGDSLLLASDTAVLKAAVDLRDATAGSLAARPSYQAARRAVGADAVGLLFVDLEKVRQAPGFVAGLDGSRENPLAALLFAGMPSALKTAPWLALGFYVDGSGFSVKAVLGEVGGGWAEPGFVGGGKGAGLVAEGKAVPRQIAGLSLQRDLGKFYAAKDDLFPQRTSGLIFFENMMGIFFSGRNLTDDVLAQTTSDIQVVVARQEYNPAIGTPDPQWPAMAVVFGLRDPARFGETLEEAWQKALGLVNFTRGQKAEPGLILDRAEHRGTPISVARFSDKEVKDRQHLDPRFNVRPTLALAGGRAILSSTEQLARDLIDAKGTTEAAGSGTPAGTGLGGQVHTRLVLSGKDLADALGAGRAGLVRDNMLKEGHNQAEAEAGVDTLIAVVGWLDRATLTLGGESGRPQAELRASFRQP